MPVPAPTARLSYSTMGHGVIDGNRFGLHPFYEPSVMERKTRTIALARRGTCNQTSSIGTFLINSLSGFLSLWDLRLALQMESKVLFARSFGFDACSRIDLPCMSLSWMKCCLVERKKTTYCWVLAEMRKQKLLFHNISDMMCYETVFGGKQKHEFKHVVSRAWGEGDSYVAASGKNIPGQI